MKIGFKGFNENLKCNGYQYNEGEVHVFDGNISMCSRGFHYCETLSQVFYYYRRLSNNKFAIIADLGDKTQTSKDKCVTEKIKILKVLSLDEIDVIVEEETAGKRDSQYNIKLAKHLNDKYNVIIGGSTSLYIRGIDLRAMENGYRDKPTDLDVVIPYFQLFKSSDSDDFIAYDIEQANSGNSFDYSVNFRNKISEPACKVDVKIDPYSRYDIVNFKGVDFKITRLFDVLTAKIEYAKKKNGLKHEIDILNMLGLSSYGIVEKEDKKMSKESIIKSIVGNLM